MNPRTSARTLRALVLGAMFAGSFVSTLALQLPGAAPAPARFSALSPSLRGVPAHDAAAFGGAGAAPPVPAGPAPQAPLFVEPPVDDDVSAEAAALDSALQLEEPIETGAV
jgi:hypothetical protein